MTKISNIYWWFLLDDLEVSEDFYEYFLGTYSLLRTDPTLWCVSAWNDNGNEELVDDSQPQLLYRTDFFPGLGWMLTGKLNLKIFIGHLFRFH